ncbi:MAG: glycosyltransferase [Chitinophagaceae bacterium]
MKKKKILILCPSPKGTAPTQRLKYEQYLNLLEENGYHFTISSFQTNRLWDIIYKPGRTLEKIFWTCVGYLKRAVDLVRAPFYDAVYVNLWVTPIGFPLYEYLLLFVNRKVIYDIDDMIFLKKTHLKESIFQRMKGREKPIVLMKSAKYVITSAPKLTEIAIGLNKHKNIITISSTLNTTHFTPVNCYKKTESTTLGWTGTHSTIRFLEILQPVLAEVAKIRNIKLLVIANKEYEMPEVPTEFMNWQEATEVSDLHRIEIGLYPIPANEWSLGKSSLKAVTYMAVGLPVVASAYGTNFMVIEHGITGFLASNEQEWIDNIIKLIDDVELRKKMGTAGRQRVEIFFSVKANFSKYLHVFQTVLSEN